jgi:hypothetical protein
LDGFLQIAAFPSKPEQVAAMKAVIDPTLDRARK